MLPTTTFVIKIHPPFQKDKGLKRIFWKSWKYCELLPYKIFINQTAPFWDQLLYFPSPHISLLPKFRYWLIHLSQIYSWASCANIFFCQHLLLPTSFANLNNSSLFPKLSLLNICCNHISYQSSICCDKNLLFGRFVLQISV